MSFKKYLFSILLFTFLYSGNADHLIFNRISVTSGSQMMEIYNPLDYSVDLSNYYLSDSDKYYIVDPTFFDCHNFSYTWTEAEDFSDDNDNGVYDCTVCDLSNPDYDGEDFTDDNGNGFWDDGECSDNQYEDEATCLNGLDCNNAGCEWAGDDDGFECSKPEGEESIGNFDFLIQFPEGVSIGPKGTYTITTEFNSTFLDSYDDMPDLSLKDSVFDVFEFGVSPKLQSEEMLILFYRENTLSIIQDVDYFLWGDYDKGVSKTVADEFPGCTDSDACYYNNDTPLEDQIFIRSYGSSESSDSLYVRVCNNEIDELMVGGNGITGHDETSENLVFSWMIEGVEKVISFQDIINGDYDCPGSSQDGCSDSVDCPTPNPTGVLVDYFDITIFNGPHALTIEDPEGYRVELTIWPDTWDIAADPNYSFLLNPPYGQYVIQASGPVFEYQGEKQILICSPDQFEIVANFSDADGSFQGFEDINGNLIQDDILVGEPYIDLNVNELWDANFPFCSLCFDTINTSCIDQSITQSDCIEQGLCSKPNLLNEQECNDECEEWIVGDWFLSEPYEDLNENGQWDQGIEEDYDFNKASINPAPYILVPSAAEVLDYSYSFPSNSRVIIRVFDISGRFITTLIDKYYESSGIVSREEFYSSWDGTNQMGQIQSPGTYLMHMEASNFQTGKTTVDIAPVVIGVNK